MCDTWRCDTWWCDTWSPLKGSRPAGATHGDDGQHGVGGRVPEQHVDEGDDLQGLAQAHAVGQDAAQPAARRKALRRLHQVVVQEADPADLGENGRGGWRGGGGGGGRWGKVDDV